jgi:hypothetical protein
LVDLIAPHQLLKIYRHAEHGMAELDATAALIAQHWMDVGILRESVPWLLTATSDAVRYTAFSVALLF